MVLEGNIFNFQSIFQKELFTTQGFDVILSKPLERSVRFGNEAGSTYSYLATTFAGYFIIFILNFLSQVSDCQNVFISFKGQANHKVQLNTVPTGFESCSYCIHQIFFSYAFIDNVTHFLATCFRSKGQATFTNSLYFFSNINGEAIDTQGRQAYAYTFIFKFCNQIMYQGSKAGVIGTAQRY